MKTLSYSYVKYSLRVPLLLLTVKKIKCENFDFALFLSSIFFCLLSFPSCMWAKIDKLQPKMHIAVAFLYAILCKRHFTYQTIALLSEILILLVRPVCELLLESYGSKYVLQPLSDTTFLHTYTHNSITTGCIQTFYISNDCSTLGDVYFLC